MDIQLQDIRIQFDADSETPFFQVEDAQRVRFDLDELGSSYVINLLNKLFVNNVTTEFLSEQLKPVKFREKTKIGRFVTIKNWYEQNYVTDEQAYIMVRIEDINVQEIIKYILFVKRSRISPYMVIYDSRNLVYVSDDVLDVVSGDLDTIADVKVAYQDLYDKYYEEK